MSSSIAIESSSVEQLIELERSVPKLFAKQLDKKTGTFISQILTKFKGILIEDGKEDSALMLSRDNDRFVLVRAGDAYKDAIWKYVYPYLNGKLQSILGEARSNFEMLVCRLPYEGVKYGTLTLAGTQFSSQLRNDFVSILNDESFLFPSSIFLRPESGCSQAACLIDGEIGSDVTAFQTIKGLCTIFHSHNLVQIPDVYAKQYEGFKKHFAHILKAYRRWIQIEENAPYGIFFIPSGFDGISRTALLCPVLLKQSTSCEQIRSLYYRLWMLARTVGVICENHLSQLIELREKESLLLANTYSAIGSIMSRNGSHNIGSHVLSALSHNIGTMPDDRMLYQYIQHRMDYIATATTDFPTWRQPTMFLGTMMKTFLSQRHLLDHIAASEGLRAWKFQGRGVDAERSSIAKIKFHIRRILEDGRAQEVLSYKAAEGTVELDGDVALAIPGGTVGQHAFFTIIENVIRNAAKHDWSSPPSKIKDKGVKVIDSNGKVTKGNLEIFIDYKDIPGEGNVEFTIFANMSDANEVLDASNGKTVFDKVEQAVTARFIDDGGTLRRANWGIAEMKISAGYLQSREPGVIGGLESTSKKALSDNDRFGPEIIKPVKVKEDIDDVDGIEHLGYRFKVAKPRTLLIVVDKELEKLTPEREKDLAALGVYIKTKTSVSANEVDNSFEFVLIDSFTKEQLTWLLPFRIVCVAKRSEMLPRIRELVATLEDGSIPNSGETAASIAETLLSCRRFQLKDKVNGLLTRVSACWIGYLKRRRMIAGPYNLVVNVEAQSDGSSQTKDASGQSLVNEAAAVSFVFEEGFKNVVEGFKELYKVEYAELKQILDVLTTKARKVDVDQYVKQSDDDCRKLIKMQMGSWLKDCNIDGAGDMRNFLESAKNEEKDCPLRKFVDYLEQTCKQAKGYLGKYSEKIVTLPKHFIAGRSAQSQQQPVRDDANVIERIFPSVYTTPSIKYIRHFKPKVATSRTPDEIKNGTPPDFVTKPFLGLGEGPSVLYIEPLSGTQSYLTQIQTQINKEDGVFEAKLVENALLRILIVDERVSKFISDHSDSTLATLSRMSIFIADDKAVTETLEAERDGKVNEQKHANVVKPSPLGKDVAFTPDGLVRLDVDGVKALRDKIISGESVETLGESYRPFKERFDILIIHQGILDKWFRGVVDDESMSSNLYDSFKKVFSYVVITTGRGTPANIPNMARVLPFSTIETTLFRKYPEKLILVDAIMNLLPHKKTNGEVVS